jgi:hypothetical protein
MVSDLARKGTVHSRLDQSPMRLFGWSFWSALLISPFRSAIWISLLDQPLLINERAGGPALAALGVAEPQSLELTPNLTLPASVGPGARGAGMENLAEVEVLTRQAGLGPARGEGPHADHPLGFEDPDQVSKEIIAGREERFALGHG